MPLKPAIIQKFKSDMQSCLYPSQIELQNPPYNESWLQDLIHTNPALVPAGEVEAVFENIVPVVRELPLASGFLDNLYMTPDGYPVLVEVKLWKNQEARRKVVAQILEYAKDFAALKYENLNTEIRKLRKGEAWGDNPLHEIVSRGAPNTLDEATFVDRVCRNLREGRFLLLILGDGVREEMEGLANYLMRHSLRYAFGIVQIRLFTLPDGSVLALPDVMAKTQTIERHVTVVLTPNADAQVSEIIPAPQIVGEKVEKTSLSLDEFYNLMAEKDPRNVAFIKELMNKLSDLSIEPEVGRTGETLMLKATIPGGERLLFAHFSPETVQFWGIPYKAWKFPAWQKLSLAYLERVAAFVPGAKVHLSNTQAEIKQNGKALRINTLHGKESEMAEAIQQAVRDAEAFYAEENITAR